MALLTAGTKLTTSLQALQWKRSGMNQTDLAALLALSRNPVTGAYGGASLENGILYLPNQKAEQGIKLNSNDWICVDGAGWVIVIPAATFATSWQHS
jgi:hypothetical protein